MADVARDEVAAYDVELKELNALRETIRKACAAKSCKDKDVKAPPEAWMFQTGANTWETYDRWPPKNATARKIYLHANGIWQQSLGGLRFGSPSGDPFPPPGDMYVLDTAEKLQDFHRLFRNNYWQVGGGVSYSVGAFDVFASYTQYVWGTDTHDGHAYTVGATWYFGGSK